MKYFLFILSFASIFFCRLCDAAFADPPAEADFLWSMYGFTSPGNTYGQRNEQEIRARFHVGSDSPGADLVNQNDADVLAPEHGQYVLVDDYHQFRDGSFGYLSLGAGSGNSVPLHNAYAEYDRKVTRSAPLVFALGGDTTSNANGVVERYASIGPTYYFKNGSVTLRYMPTSISNGGSSPSGEVSLQVGPDSVRNALITVQFGNSPPFLAQNGLLAAGSGQRAIDVGLMFKSRIHRDVSLMYGGDYTHLVDVASGNLVYIRRGLSLGLVKFTGGP